MSPPYNWASRSVPLSVSQPPFPCTCNTSEQTGQEWGILPPTLWGNQQTWLLPLADLGNCTTLTPILSKGHSQVWEWVVVEPSVQLVWLYMWYKLGTIDRCQFSCVATNRLSRLCILASCRWPTNWPQGGWPITFYLSQHDTGCCRSLKHLSQDITSSRDSFSSGRIPSSR